MLSFGGKNIGKALEAEGDGDTINTKFYYLRAKTIDCTPTALGHG
jgi:hypothetical protein